ncbi:transmembrane protein 231 isoform X2 [Parasteatoda tepidariorum]|uniref:transmembrane protein 231 isoform X2 n=1 Tax=Parasteatoda tepidariorum TaxID=114398 RepID=UPI000A2C0BDC|nr:transmembrane protein 231 isoform X2 [Parasteatoda tepidariorum]
MYYSVLCFWRKVDFYREQPDISFKHKMLIILETKPPNQMIFWSTYENINEVMKQDVFQSLPEIEHREGDSNRDGIKDELEMMIDFPLSNQEIIAAKIILIFDYKLSLYSHFRMESAAFIHHSSSYNGSEFIVMGDLSLNQREPLKLSGEEEKFNVPVIKDSFIKPPYNLEEIFLEYSKRNFTTVFTNTYPVWKPSKSKSESFKINILIKYPAETILYTVGFWQLLKWALVQYVAVFMIISYLINYIRKRVFQNQLLPSIVIDPIKQKV